MKLHTFKTVQLCLALFASLILPLSLQAQTAATGALSGTVSDTSGAVIPGATVVATHTETGQTRTVTTGADGSYRIPLLQPGSYGVKFSANGFKTTEVPNITIAVTETPVLDQKLEVGAQAEQVTVDATVETIQTSNATLGTVLGGSQVTGLPLASRNYTNVLALSAGVDAGVINSGQLGKGGMALSANGASTGSNNIQIDGMNVTTMTGQATNVDNFSGSSGTLPVPNPDSLQEFKVQTSSYDAGYGRNSGANINIVTKSGTNEWHGTAFEFFRNTDLNANDFFLNLAGKPKGVLNQNQYGGVIGGPIKKNKLFIFGSYQGTVQKNGYAAQGNDAITLPPIPNSGRSNTAAFTFAAGQALCPANHPGNSQFNTARGGVQVACDGSNINPVAISMMQFQLPNGQYLFPGSTNGLYQNTNFSTPARYNEKQEMVNGDYIISQKHTLSLKFFNSYAPSTLPFIAATEAPGMQVGNLYFDTTALAKVTSVLTPSIVNEFRVSFHRDFVNDAPQFTMTDHQFGITPVSPYLDSTIPGFMSQFQIAGAYYVGVNGNSYDGWNSTAGYQNSDQISWTHGKHTIRTGYEIEQIRWNWNYPGLGQGNMQISSFSDFLLGLPGCTPGNTACSATNPGNTNGTAFSSIFSTMADDGVGPAGNSHRWQLWDVGAFVQDDYKVSQHLTINMGLRYDYNGFVTAAHGIQTNTWPSAILATPIPGTTPATGSISGYVEPANFPGPVPAGLTISPTNSTLASGPPKDNFGPRLGFAYAPFSKFVVRGGVGYFYDRIPSNDFVNSMNLSCPQACPADASGAGNYYATLQVPSKVITPGTFTPRWVNIPALTSSAFNYYAFDPHWSTPLIYSYNIGIQYNFLPSWVLDLGYVGSHGIHGAIGLSDNYNLAQWASPTAPVWGSITTNTVSNAVVRVPYLGYGQINSLCTCVNSLFSSLQATVRKQMSHGLQVQAAFTWLKSEANSALTQEANNFIQDNWGTNPAVHPLRMVINYSYAIPSGNMKGFAGAILGGWSVSGVTTIQSGNPLTITDATGGSIYDSPISAGTRAQLVAGDTYANIPTPGSLTQRLGGAAGGCGFFAGPSTAGSLNGITCKSLSAFTPVPDAVAPDGVLTNGTGWGNTGIGIILGPGQFNFDAALLKMTRVGGIHENATLQFRMEMFNMFNHPQFNNPNLGDAAGTFGQITSTSVNPRLIQLSLKYIF